MHAGTSKDLRKQFVSLGPVQRVILGLISAVLVATAYLYATAHRSVVVLAPGAACAHVTSPTHCKATIDGTPDTAVMLAILIGAALCAVMALTGMVWGITVGSGGAAPVAYATAGVSGEEATNASLVGAVTQGAAPGKVPEEALAANPLELYMRLPISVAFEAEKEWRDTFPGSSITTALVEVTFRRTPTERRYYLRLQPPQPDSPPEWMRVTVPGG